MKKKKNKSWPIIKFKKKKHMSLTENCKKYEKHVLNTNKFLSFDSFNETNNTRLPNCQKVYNKFIQECDTIRKEMNLEQTQNLPRVPSLLSIFEKLGVEETQNAAATPQPPLLTTSDTIQLGKVNVSAATSVRPKRRAHSPPTAQVEPDKVREVGVKVEEKKAEAVDAKVEEKKAEPVNVKVEEKKAESVDVKVEKDVADTTPTPQLEEDVFDSSAVNMDTIVGCEHEGECDCASKVEEHYMDLKPLAFAPSYDKEAEQKEQQYYNALQTHFPEMRDAVVLIPPKCEGEVAKEHLQRTTFLVEHNLEKLQKYMDDVNQYGGEELEMLDGTLVPCSKLNVQWGEEDKLEGFSKNSDTFMCLHVGNDI